MALLLIFFLFPILFGAKLLGASWLLAAFIACVFWPVFFVVWGLVIMPALEARDRRRGRRARAKLAVERETRRLNRLNGVR